MLYICSYEQLLNTFILSIRKLRFIGLTTFSLESIVSQVEEVGAEQGHKVTAS